MDFRSAYGLSIASELALDELPRSERADCDVTVSRGFIARAQSDELLWGEPRALCFAVPGVARFLVEDGRTIQFDPDERADAASIRLFLLGSALGALLMQRGLTVFHGNAVRVGEKAVVCIGPSGAGKSTLAAAFHQLGHPVIADDVVALDAANQVMPGPPRAKLWRDAALDLGLDVERLARVRPGLEKYVYPLPVEVSSATPPAAIYILATKPIEALAFERVEGHHRFLPLRRHLYRPAFVEFLDLTETMMQRVARLAQQNRVVRIRRPAQGVPARRIAEAILDDLAAHG